MRFLELSVAPAQGESNTSSPLKKPYAHTHTQTQTKLKIIKSRDQRDVPVIKSTCCSCRRHGVLSLIHTRQTKTTHNSTSKTWDILFWLPWATGMSTHGVHRHTCRQCTHMHKKEKRGCETVLGSGGVGGRVDMIKGWYLFSWPPWVNSSAPVDKLWFGSAA